MVNRILWDKMGESARRGHHRRRILVIEVWDGIRVDAVIPRRHVLIWGIVSRHVEGVAKEVL
jgi:hypothetical protein